MALDSLVSILLPAYDAEATLEDCLRSVERQTRRTGLRPPDSSRT